jgi:hypothetical protein
MDAILDFDTELDVGLLDRVVAVMYTSSGAEVILPCTDDDE